MKKFIIHSTCALWLLAGMTLAAAVTARVSSDPVAAGEPFMLEVQSTDGEPQLRSVPKLANGSWKGSRGTSQSYQNINGQVTRSIRVSYVLIADKPGELVIPPLEFNINGRTEKTAELRVKVVSAAERQVGGAETAIPLGEAVYGKIRVPGDRRQFYLGEEIPVVFDLYCRDGIGAQLLSYPEPEFKNVVFCDYRSVNPKDGRFQQPMATRQNIDGKNYTRIEIRSAFRALAAGELKLNAKTVVGIPDSRRSQRRSPFDDDDDFFGGFFGRGPSLKQYEIEYATGPVLDIVPLPPPPSDAVSLGLVGDWQIRYELDGATAPKVGEVLTLRILLRGADSGETLTAPKLKLPGFRVYPAEIKRQAGGGVSLQYQMIPLRPGKTELALKLAVFNPGDKKYRIAEYAKLLQVAASDRPLDAVVAGRTQHAEESVVAENGTEAENAPSNALLYLKNAPSGDPVGATRLWFWILVLAGPFFWMVMELIAIYRDRLAADPGRQRRQRARGRRSAVIDALGSCENNVELGKLVNAEVVPLLADSYDLPPGLSAEELADKLEDPEFGQVLRRLSDSAFCPGVESPDVGINREILIKLIKKTVMLLLVGGLWISSASAEESFKAGNAAYDRGDFARAVGIYQDALQPLDYDPALLYNLGSTYYMSQNFPLAVLHFEQARRMNPGDSAALENLNLARRKLGLPETGRVNSPEDLLVYCRDRFTPSGWLVIAAAGWLLCFIGLGLRHVAGRHTVRLLYLGGGVILLLAVTAVISARSTAYHPSRCIVLSGGAELKSLPAPTGRSEGVVPAGHEVRILEERSDYALIRYGKTEGWVARKSIAPVFGREMPLL